MSVLNTASISGISVFRFQDVTLRYLGLVPPQTTRYRYLYYLYSFILNAFITIGYPTHLMIGLFKMQQKADIFKNMCVTFTCIACSIKIIAFWWRLPQVRKTYNIILKLDRRITHPDDIKLYKSTILLSVKRVLIFVITMSLSAFSASEMATIIVGIMSEWRLMNPAYFPFEIEQSAWHYAVAHIYQASGVVMNFQTCITDSFPSMVLAMLAGHIRLLGIRVARIGKQSTNAHNIELQQCIEDYKDLLDFRATIQSIVSVGTFAQLLATGINMCVVIFYMLFYVNDVAWYIYYVVYLVAISMEIFPQCYYGTCAEMEFEKLTYALFSCNWMDQSAAFKKNLRIFAEQTLRKQIILAGGLFPVNLDTFFATLKGAYSLYAVVKQMK
ncbi:odorant receptor 59a-like [Rhagoletis pomonella]|uniref:odorant receptor 59a-like n=1 Tax=Rhagoletis pomonella TaxID=28610 RepID=UPI0017833C70|nr:odorant receptor 59a-like [Rhagoletis pomonella]